MHLTKIEESGMDYLYLNCLEHTPDALPDLARRLSDRRFGVGAAGLACVKPGENQDFMLDLYNADGSRCVLGCNGIRGLAKYVYDRGLTKKTCLTIGTDNGNYTLELKVIGTKVSLVTVTIGKPEILSPVSLDTPQGSFPATPVNLCTPHAVIFCPDLQTMDLEQLGPILECHPALPNRSRVVLACVSSPDRLVIRVWEQGAIHACSTGACAGFAAAWKHRLCRRQASVRLPSGSLWVETDGRNILLTGPAREVFEAEIEL